MAQPLSQLTVLLSDVVLPNLHGIQTSQVEQRLKTDELTQAIEEFRAEMQVRFTELRAELATCRASLEVALRQVAELSERQTVAAARGKTTLVH